MASVSATPRREGRVTLRDGRALAYAEWGDPAGRPVVLFHGAPGSRLLCPDEDATVAAAVRLVTIDRPGYGRSDPDSDLSLLTWADDYAELHGLLGLPPCPIVGWSGGGPYALACAVRTPALVSSVGLAASVAPVEAMGEGWEDERRVADLLRLDRAERLDRLLHGRPDSRVLRDDTTGSDIYLVRQGGEPDADRRARTAGRRGTSAPRSHLTAVRLAYGVASPRGGSSSSSPWMRTASRATRSGSPVPGTGPGVCVRWSSDGTRVAYVDGGAVVVRGLDGSTRAGVAGDPRVGDFAPRRAERPAPLASGDGRCIHRQRRRLRHRRREARRHLRPRDPAELLPVCDRSMVT